MGAGVRVLPIIGQTLTRVVRCQDGDENDALAFVLDARVFWMMHHHQDCCESVRLEDVAGDFNDLVGTPILQADEVTSPDGSAQEETSEWGDVTQWTFYLLRTIRGSVTLRWCGSSNGYYSMSVDESWMSGAPERPETHMPLTGWRAEGGNDAEVELDRIEATYGISLRGN